MVGRLQYVRFKKNLQQVSGGPVNILTPLSWIQGTNTVLSVAGGRARATRAGGNPRIYKTVPGLVNGATYKLVGNIYIGTADATVRMRVSTTVDLPDGGVYEEITGIDAAIDHDMVSTGVTWYIGIVAVASIDGQYSEVTENLSLVRIS